MPSHIRVLLASLAFAGLLTACGSDDSSYSTDTTADSASAVNQSTSADATPASGITQGMSEAAAIALLGEPSVRQSHSINEIEVTQLEWNTSDALISAQFHNGQAVHSQYWPAQ